MIWVKNDNGGASISAGGNFLTLSVPTGGTGVFITNVSYQLVSNSNNIAVTFQEMDDFGTWRALANPPTIATVSGQTYSGSIPGSFKGIRINTSGSALSYGVMKGQIVP